MTSRRGFIKSAALGVAAVSARGSFSHAIPVLTTGNVREQIDSPTRRSLALAAIDAARSGGAQYADVRIGSSAYQYVSAGASTMGGGPPRVGVRSIQRAENVLYGVRVLVNGVWGFVSGTVPTPDAVTAVARRAISQAKANYMTSRPEVHLAPSPATGQGQWTRPVRIDPFTVSYEDQIAMAVATVEAGLKVKNVESVSCGFDYTMEDRVFASTEGAVIEQRFYIAMPQFGGASISVSDPNDTSSTAGRSVESLRLSGLGWEQVVDAKLVETIAIIGEEASAMLGTKPMDVGRYEVVFDGYSLAPIIGDTIGHALELDRALGFEADAGGTTFAAPVEDVLGKMQIGTPLLTLTGDRSQHGSLGSAGWDDEGVKPETFTLVKDGVVTDYITTRELASHLDWWYKQNGVTTRSHGCANCQSADYIPIQNLPNLRIAPSKDDVSFDDLVSGVKRGVAVMGGSMGSIDQQRINGQYQGAVVREIRDGKLSRYLKDTAFQFNTVQFWRSLEALGGERTYAMAGAASGKGDPYQVVAHSIGSVAAKFRDVNVIELGRTG